MLDAPADSTNRILTLPDIAGLSPTYFVALRLEDSTGRVVGSNFYWLSTKPEILDWNKSNWYTTPMLSYADFTALSQLPKVKLKVASHTEHTREKTDHPRGRRKSQQESGVFCPPKGQQGSAWGRDSAGAVGGQLLSRCSQVRRRKSALATGRAPWERRSPRRSQRVECGVDRVIVIPPEVIQSQPGCRGNRAS